MTCGGFVKLSVEKLIFDVCIAKEFASNEFCRVDLQRGVLIQYTRCAYTIHTVCLYNTWCAYAIHTVCLYNTHGVLIQYTRCAYAIHTVCLCNTHGVLIHSQCGSRVLESF